MTREGDFVQYKVVTSSGDKIIVREFDAVENFVVINDVYTLKDVTGKILFTAPLNSVLYVEGI